MKKIVLAIIFSLFLVSVSYADMSRVEMGAGVWFQTPSGTAAYNAIGTLGGTDTFNEKQKTLSYAWLLIKHPIPVVPDIRLEYSALEATGNPKGTWGNETFISGTSKINGTQYDIIPYYNLLDNTAWITLDVGLDAKVMQVKYRADEIGLISYEAKKTFVVPMGYVRVRVEIPTTNIGIESDLKYFSYQNSRFSDMSAKIDYTFSSVPVVQPAIEIGYRQEKIKIDSSSYDVKTDIIFAGFYAGVMLRF
jgi:outer membrane protein